MTLADLNGDVCQDYVVGAAGVGFDSGAVDLILSGTAGPQLGNAVRIDGDGADRFGTSLAVSQRGSQIDLWVGAPGYAIGGPGGIDAAGAVYHYAFTKGDTLTPHLAGIITEAHPTTGDHFGAVLSVNYGLTNAPGGPTDAVLMVGTPDRSVDGQYHAGEVTWIRCDGRTGATSTVLVLNQDSPAVPGVAEAGDRFGAAVSQPPVGYDSLIGIPGEAIGSLRDAGMVQPVVLHRTGSRSILLSLDQDSPGVPGVVEAGDQFGAAVLNDPSRLTRCR